MKKKTDKQRLFEVMGKLDKTFKLKLNETGEWSNDEDNITWMDALKSDVKTIEQKTDGKLQLIDVKGFDKYQGPYAIVKINGRDYKIWTIGEGGENLLWIEDYPVDNTSSEDMNAGFMGNVNTIIDMLNNGTEPQDPEIGHKEYLKQTNQLKSFDDDSIDENKYLPPELENSEEANKILNKIIELLDLLNDPDIDQSEGGVSDKMREMALHIINTNR